MLNFDAHFSMPGMVLPELQEVVNKTGLFWGRADRLNFLGAAIDGSARDAGNTGYTDTLRPGLLMGRVTATGKLKQWDPTATDGTQVIYGVLIHPLKVTYQGTSYDRLVGGWICVNGGVRASGIVIPSSTTEGISGATQEFNIRRMMAGAFQFDDYPQGFATRVLAVSADKTLTDVDTGSIIIVAGASGAVNITLPATAKLGVEYTIYNQSNQNLTITAGTADTLVTLNDAAADSIALSTSSEKIGGGFRIVGDGSLWNVMPMLWEAQTVTPTT